jgi:nucleoside-diphosphate-sugar epimerase
MDAPPRVRRVLVTGATGFIGRHCLNALLMRDIELHAVAQSIPKGPLGRTAWRACDLRDPQSTERLVADLRPSHILHCAWMATPGRFWTDLENLQWLYSGLAMLSAFRKHGGERFTGAGTCAEYISDADKFIEEQTPISPATLYGKSKAALWTAAQAFASDGGPSVSWGRIFMPYGPGDNPQRLIPTIIAALKEGRPVLLTAGNQERDFVHVKDVADLLVKLLFSEHTGAFNVGAGRPTSIRYVAEYLAGKLASPKLLNFGARPMPTNEPLKLVADTERVTRIIGWAPSVTLEPGLDALIENE